MTGTGRQSAAAPGIARAATLIQRLPLRWSDHDEGGAEESVIARGWFRGANECARVLAAGTRLERCEGKGFGANWPILGGGAWTVAPALPVAVSGETVAGVDGEYRTDSSGVWRESLGAEDLFLTSDMSQPAPGVPFDLLWFGDSERFTVRSGTLEIEDLFGALRVPVSPQLLDRLLLRSRRVAAEALDDLPMIGRQGAQTIEVRRPEELICGDRWRDPSGFLEARADIESARPRGAAIESKVVDGSTAIFECDEREDGWLLTLREGRYVFSQFRVLRSAKTLSLCATLNSEIDALAPGMRGRLIFDLRTDLVTLG